MTNITTASILQVTTTEFTSILDSEMSKGVDLVSHMQQNACGLLPKIPNCFPVTGAKMIDNLPLLAANRGYWPLGPSNAITRYADEQEKCLILCRMPSCCIC